VRGLSVDRLSRHHVPFTVVFVALGVAVADSLSKIWARHSLVAGPKHILGPLWFQLQYNTGLAFSFRGAGTIVTSIIVLVVSAAVLVSGLRARPGAVSWGFGLLIGGGVANAIDRFAASPHEVTDFIAVGSFPIFNLADASITIGFLVLLVKLLQGEKLLT
jgi:signal peptidase II